MEVLEQKYSRPRQDNVAGGSTTVQHRHFRAQVGRLLHQHGSGRASVLEQRVAEDLAGCQEEGKDLAGLAHFAASWNPLRRLEARRMHLGLTDAFLHLGSSTVLHSLGTFVNFQLLLISKSQVPISGRNLPECISLET
jgi:hypothetical protein